jgi:hypothetical protein
MNKKKQEWRVFKLKERMMRVLSDISTCLIWNLNLRVCPQKESWEEKTIALTAIDNLCE